MDEFFEAGLAGEHGDVGHFFRSKFPDAEKEFLAHVLALQELCEKVREVFPKAHILFQGVQISLELFATYRSIREGEFKEEDFCTAISGRLDCSRTIHRLPKALPTCALCGSYPHSDYCEEEGGAKIYVWCSNKKCSVNNVVSMTDVEWEKFAMDACIGCGKWFHEVKFDGHAPGCPVALAEKIVKEAGDA